MVLVQGRISQRKLSVCTLAVLGSQGIVVKCTAAFIRTMDLLFLLRSTAGCGGS